jgi:hypothetical protein
MLYEPLKAENGVAASVTPHIILTVNSYSKFRRKFKGLRVPARFGHCRLGERTIKVLKGDLFVSPRVTSTAYDTVGAIFGHVCNKGEFEDRFEQGEAAASGRISLARHLTEAYCHCHRIFRLEEIG